MQYSKGIIDEVMASQNKISPHHIHCEGRNVWRILCTVQLN